MAHAGRIVALGLTLVVGGLGGYAVATAQQPTAVQVVSSEAPTQTVTATVQAEPITVSVTVEPQPTDDPNGPKANGNYLVGAELAPGTWQCGEGDASTFWRTKDQGGDTIDNGFGTLASVDEGYSADLLDCRTTWAIVG